MRTIRILFRMFRLFSMGYTVWRGTRLTKTVMLVRFVWKLLHRDEVSVTPRVAITVADPHTDVIYRRRGWRKIARRQSG